MGYVPPRLPEPDLELIDTIGGRSEPIPPRLNLDRFGMPLDYATYCWLLYGEVVEDKSPARRAFLHGPTTSNGWTPGHMDTLLVRS